MHTSLCITLIEPPLAKHHIRESKSFLLPIIEIQRTATPRGAFFSLNGRRSERNNPCHLFMSDNLIKYQNLRQFFYDKICQFSPIATKDS